MQQEQSSQVNEKLVKQLQELLKLPEEDRERLIELCRKYPPQKIIRAVMSVTMYKRKNMKLKTKLTVEEFEKIVRKTRF